MIKHIYIKTKELDIFSENILKKYKHIVNSKSSIIGFSTIKIIVINIC